MFRKNILAIFIFIISVGCVSAALDCTVRFGSCNANETKMLGLSNVSNAHAELASENDYDYHLCCRDDAGTYTINTSCGTEMISLSNSTDAHVEKRDVDDYSYPACADTTDADMDVACYYDTSCHAGKSCVLTLGEATDDAGTNMHIADCVTDPYAEKLCCGLANLPDYDDFFKPNTPTTDFEAVSDLSFVSEMVLADASGSQIRWNVPVDAEGEPYDTHVVVEDEFVSLNLSGLKESVNVNATVTVNVGGCDNWNIYYLNTTAETWNEFINHPDVITVGSSGTGCNTVLPGDADPYCSNPVCSGGTLTYDVLHFDSTGGEGSGMGGAGVIPEFSTVGMILALVIIAMGIVVIRKKR